jgi:hypothetical protein
LLECQGALGEPCSSSAQLHVSGHQSFDKIAHRSPERATEEALTLKLEQPLGEIVICLSDQCLETGNRLVALFEGHRCLSDRKVVLLQVGQFAFASVRLVGHGRKDGIAYNAERDERFHELEIRSSLICGLIVH